MADLQFVFDCSHFSHLLLLFCQSLLGLRGRVFFFGPHRLHGCLHLGGSGGLSVTFQRKGVVRFQCEHLRVYFSRLDVLRGLGVVLSFLHEIGHV